MRGRKPGNPKVQDLADGRFKVIDGGGTGGPPADDDKHATPAWVKDAHARDCWRRLLPDLLKRKQYIPLFEQELGRYCVAFGQYVRAIEAMEKTGPVVKSRKKVPMLSQHWVVANRAHEAMCKLAADLGLNPVAQMRLAGVQLDLFDQPRPGTGTDGGPAGPGTGFAQFRRQ